MTKKKKKEEESWGGSITQSVWRPESRLWRPSSSFQMPLSVRTKEKETNSQLNLISVQETRFSHLPRTNERAKNRSFKSLCVCVVLSEWHYCSFRIRRGSLTNRLDVVLKNKTKKNLAFRSAMLFSWLPHHFSQLPCEIALAARTVSIGRCNLVSFLFIHSCFESFISSDLLLSVRKITFLFNC